jgi:hypothetical protein
MTFQEWEAPAPYTLVTQRPVWSPLDRMAEHGNKRTRRTCMSKYA